MIRKLWIVTLSVALTLTLTQCPAFAQYGPPASGPSAAILFTPATVNLVAGLNGSGSAGNGGLATAAQLNYPVGIGYDSSGNLFVADSSNYVVRRIDHITGVITVFAGTNATFGDSLGGGVATSAQIGIVAGLVIDTSNNVYVSDRSNNVVWKITSGGTISLYAGSGTSGLGDGGPATSAELSNPWALGIDANNNIYISDSYNDLVRVVNHTTNIITTFAGVVADAGGFGNCSAGGLYSISTPPYTPTQAHLCFPEGVAFDSSGNAYIVDEGHKLIREVSKSTGTISTFAGGGTQAANVNNVPATSAAMTPSGIFIDPGNRVYIADNGGGLVRVVDSTGNINTEFGNGFGDLTSAAIGLPDTQTIVNNVGPSDGIYDMAMDTFGNLIAASSSGVTITSAGTAGQYRFPQVQIFTTETTTQANTTSPFYPPYITISNPSGVALNLAAAPVVTGPFAIVTGTGAGTCVFPGSLAAGQSCTVVVSFTPTLGGSPGTVQTGTVVIVSNANSTPSTISLYGTGTGTATVTATLTPSPLTFTSPANITSAAQTATLTNTGQLPIAIGSTPFSGVSASNFAVSATTCPSGSATLAVGASCTYSITFTPIAATNYAAGFQACITTSSYGCLTVGLQGTGTAGATATFLPTPLAFGSGYVGQTSAAMSATLTNTSSTAISISSFGVTGTSAADFAIGSGTNACGGTLAASASCNVYVTFTPASAASFSAQLAVTDSASGSPQSVAISGTGIRFVSNVGTPLAAQPVTVDITTAGTPATIGVLTLGGANLDFTSASGSTCSTATAYTVGQTCTVNVAFTPAYPGPRYGAVVLTNASGVAIGTANLIGTGNGPQIGFMPGTQTTLGSGFSNPYGIAVDGKGDIFVGDDGNNAVKEIVAAGGYTTVNTLGSGFFQPMGVAIDGSGNIYVADQQHSAVKEILAVNGTIPASPTILTLGSGFNYPAGVAVDGNGNVFVAQNNINLVQEMLAVNGTIPASPTILTIGSGFSGPAALAVDSNGDLFVADSGNNAIKEVLAVNGSIPASSPTIETIGSGFYMPQGVAIDGIGDVIVADTGNNDIKEIVAVNGSVPASPAILTLGTVNDFAFPRGVAVDGHGNVIVPDYGDNRVVKLDYADAPSLTFPTATPVGSADTTDNPITLTVENIGNATLTFPIPTSGISPTITGSFSLGSTGTCTQLTSSSSTAATLTQGSSCTLPINFTPATSGTNTGTLGFTDTSLNASSPNYAVQNVALSGTGTGATAPKATLSQSQLSYPNTNIGSSSAAQTFTITNTGTASLSIINIALGGATPSDFTTSNNCGATLAVNAFCTVSVTFSPGFPRLSLASVLVTDNASGSPQSVVITGTGIAATPQATLTGPLTFASTNVGSSAPTQTLSLSNPGNATLTISSIAITGANASSFSTTSCGSTLAASATCLITIGFTPTASGPLSATLTVTDNATAGSTQTAALNGTGAAALAPLATLSPNTLTFPSITVGVAATSLPVTLSNPGTASLVIGSILNSNAAAGFGETTTCGGSLAAGASCVITVSFTPTSAGPLSGSISVSDNAAGTPQTVTLSGTGAALPVPQAALSPSPLTFSGTTTVGSSSSPLPMTLTNGGTAALNISSIAVTGSNASSFSQTNNCSASLAAGSSCTVNVTFTPGSAAALAAAITVTDNATGSPQSAVITGTGAAVVTGGIFTVSTSTPSATVQPGGVAQFNLVIAPLGGSYNNLVTLSAIGLPPGAQVSFAPAAVTPGSAGAPSVMSIQTATGLARAELPGERGHSSVPILAILAGLPLLGFAGRLRRLRWSRGRWMLFSLAVLTIVPLLAMSGCSGGYFGPAPKTYAVTVTGTSGSLQESTTISITVQ